MISGRLPSRRRISPVQQLYDLVGNITHTGAGDSDTIPLVLNTNFTQIKGLCYLGLTMGTTSSATAKNLLCTNSATTDFIYDGGDGKIYLSDGTNSVSSDVGGWSATDTLMIIAEWDSNLSEMMVSVSKNGGAWVYSDYGTYDGAFPIGSNFIFCHNNPDAITVTKFTVYKIK